MWKRQGRREEFGGERSCVGSRESAFRGQIQLYSAALHIFPAVMLFLEVFPNLQRSAFCSLQQNVCLLFVLTTKQSFSDVRV